MSTSPFSPVPSPFSFSAAEKDIIAFWKEHQTYHRSLAARKDAPRFVFYEGPPTANGLPHPGHCLTRTIKDIFPRYKTMDGFYCERKAGWDTHGLPVEVEVCKELGILDGGKEAIEAFGIEKFNRTCIESVFRYQKQWEELTDRIGFWVDLDQAYVTYHQSYVESVWWALKRLFDRGLLYQGHKVVWWWAQGGTALSAGEVGEGYRDTDDPAITVRLRLTAASKDQLGIQGPASLLVWTTTPWTLSSNCAACVGLDIEYAVVKHTVDEGEECLIVAASLVEKTFGEGAQIVDILKGSELVGLAYDPIFRYDTPVKMEGDGASTKHWVIIAGDFVDLETGTGIVHMAPAFGEDDYRVCKSLGVGILCFVKPDGAFDARVTDVDPFDKTPIAGQFCKAADKGIVRILKDKGVLFKQAQYRHAYPFCPRAENDPLIQYARKSWFIKTSQFKDEFLANNKEIFWRPEHIRDGRFGNFLENNVDWALSRERYWGTPLPVWICESTGHMECVSSYAELMAKTDIQGAEVWAQAKAAEPNLSDHLKVHKPYIDAVTYQSPKDPAARMRRVTEVIDVWFDAGCMPFAQWGYPHLPGSKAMFDDRFPADFISEAIDQTRGWFNALLVISTIVHREQNGAWPHPFKNCICLGHILGEDGTKLSKRLKNYSEPAILFEKYSADALRWSFIAKNPPTSSTRLSDRIVEESQRELLMTWYNVYSFFVIYASLDGFDPASAPLEFLKEMAGDPAALNAAAAAGKAAFRAPAARGELDRWILNELDRTILDVREAMDRYDSYPAARAITGFIDSLSNWYVRRSRARFWASEWTQDKADAYWTLYTALLRLARLCAPFTPFFSEVTWRNLTQALPGAAESVHLAPYPVADAATLDRELLEAMEITREAVNLGLSARRTENLKVRQPLGECDLVVSNPAHRASLQAHLPLIQEELNIKIINFTDRPGDYVSYQIKPNFKVLGPRFGKQVQAIGGILAKCDAAAACQALQDGPLKIELNGETVELTSEEVEVRLSAKEGFAAAQGKHMVVVLSTEITEALHREGLVREFIRCVQEIRKDQGLAYDARIDVAVSTEDALLKSVVEEFRAVIAGEVLAEDLAVVAGPIENAKLTTIENSEIAVAVTARK
ncbi:MAG: isoleucine--tRNA ligase [Candidatus Hydrogenedentes bacterium]|nr:isoleucine--tRNA ligase [Candidatus Hydrogenedentota bacterium]